MTSTATALTSTSSTTVAAIIKLPTGSLRGCSRDNNGVRAFKGIPFAAPPVGPLRWHPPTPPTPWSGIRNARDFGHSPWSALRALPGWPTPTQESEDCLTLNVWTPATRADEKRPVMVHVHGGGFQFGGSADPMLDGAGLAAKGVVLVSFNYRLGVLGFLAHAELDGEGTVSGNYGLLDQIAALRWVRSNIAAFGGDPDNVCLFGESAGAHAIGILMASPLLCEGERLFHKAILQSGGYWDSEHGSLSTFDEARQRGLQYAKRLGASSITELRHMSPKTLTEAATWTFQEDPGVESFSPSVDGYVVSTVPAQRFQQGRQLRIPTMVSWMAVEELPFLNRALPSDSPAEFRAAAQRMFGDMTPELLSLYPADTEIQATASARALIGDLVISQQTWEVADWQHQTGEVPVFAYHQTYTSRYSPVASHGTDTKFVFGNLARIRGRDAIEVDHVFSQRLMGYLTNFAKYSSPNDPNASGLPHWPAYGEAGSGVMELGKVIAPMDYSLDRFRFLRRLRSEGVLPMKWRPGGF